MTGKIIIIDENKEQRGSIADLLHSQGFNDIEFADTGEEGIEKVKKDKHKLAVIDVLLPDFTGFEVCRRIKELDGIATKIIMTTDDKAVFNSFNIDESRMSGAIDFVSKEDDYSLLSHSIRDLIRK